MDLSPATDAIPSQPMAGGQRISAATADQAAEWLTLLMSGEASEQDTQRWRQWRAAHPDHERAWQHIEAVTGRLKVMESKAVYQALSPFAPASGAAATSPGRRKTMRLLMWGGVACTGGLLATQTASWRQATADYRTGVGEQRGVTLDDGTRIMLDTASAIDVRFDDKLRLVRLVAGEVLIVTGHAGRGGDAESRPFSVETAEGAVRALGTRFTVRQRDGQTHVAVLDSAVEIRPRAAADDARVLRAGEQMSFTSTAFGTPSAADEQADAWSRGQIVADNVRLDDFLANLGRYRTGVLRCDPAVAALRFSGVFPVQDTDRILSMLPQVLPVRVKLRTRYWVAVEAAP